MCKVFILLIFSTIIFTFTEAEFTGGSHGKPPYNPNRPGLPFVCTLPPVIGPCLALIEKWAYNPYSGQCESFIYGGCYGNPNNFATKRQCEQCCLSINSKACPKINITTCQKVVDPYLGECLGGIYDMYINYTGCGSDCPNKCGPNGPLPPPDVCTLRCGLNLCQCQPGYYRRLTDCQCVPPNCCSAKPNWSKMLPPSLQCGPQYWPGKANKFEQN